MQNKSGRNPVVFERYMIILEGTKKAICIGEGAVPEEIIENYYPRRLEYDAQNDLWEIYVKKARRNHYAKD